ncbi:MAG: low molecular weight phosphatase family protein [Thermoplasmata archaeon]
MPDRYVLFVCVENAGRSLMAEAIFNADRPRGWTASSAGTVPAGVPHPRTGPMLAEVGLRLPAHPPRLLTKELVDSALLVVTMGCVDDAHCPVYLTTLKPRDWALPDPSKLNDDGFRSVRDDLVRRVHALGKELRDRDRTDVTASTERHR